MSSILHQENLSSYLTISIIVRTKDRPHLLTRCLQSLVDQKRLPDQVIIVNDGGISIDKEVKAFPILNTMVINQETNVGRAKAGNIGVQAAEGDVVGFLDDDDRYLPEHLQRLEQVMLNFDAKVAYSGCCLLQRNMLGEKVILQEKSIGQFNEAYDAQRLQYENYIPLINLLIDRKLWLRIGGFDESFNIFEDWDVLLRLSKQVDFYHLDIITSEYAVWGKNQITQAVDSAHWMQAYSQFLQKHIMTLAEPERLAVLTKYWMVSQERRGIVQENQREHILLLHKINEMRVEHEQKLNEIYTKQEQTYSRLEREHKQCCLELEQENKQRHLELTQVHEQRYSRLSEILSLKKQAYKQRIADFEEKATEIRQQGHALHNSIYELNKQMAIGIDQRAINNIVDSHRIASISTQSSIAQDYQQLVNWTQSKANLPIILKGYFNSLQQLITTQESPQKQFYLASLENIEQEVNALFHSFKSFDEKAEDNELPPLRPLSSIYPTFMTVAGTSEEANVMENVSKMGELPFLLDRDVSLVFSVYCTLNNFFQIKLLLGTRLRINICQVRVIIRELNQQAILRVCYFNAFEVFDNQLHTISFEPIKDSMGKTYQIEVDSPNANENAGIAILCHAKKPIIQHPQQLPDHVALDFPCILPEWVQKSLLDSPLHDCLFSDSPEHIFVINGMKWTTSILQLHTYLNKISSALKQVKSQGQVILSGEVGGNIRQHFQQYQFEILDHADLPTLLKYAEKQGKGDYFWLCDVHAVPSLDMIERAIEVFTDCPKVSTIVPLEKRRDGKIRATYGLMGREAELNFLPVGDPADHPYHNYRRVIDVASTTLIVSKINTLSYVDIDKIADYNTAYYQLAELIGQLKANQLETIYEAALCYENQQPCPEFNEALIEQDREQFYQRWYTQLPRHSALFGDLDILLNPQQQPSVLIIDGTLPTFDEDSGSLRIYTLMKIWVSLGYRLTFFPDNLDSTFKYRHALEALGIEVFHTIYKLEDALAYRHFDFAFICRVDIGYRYLSFVQMMRLISPKTTIFYDTVDIHYIRERRQAEIEGSEKLAIQAEDTRRRELSNCLLADRVITVTEDDGLHLQKELPNVQFSVIPNIHTAHPLSDSKFEQREGLVFIGNYNHQPNEDSVYFFIERVLPKIHAVLPDVCFYVVGSNMKDKMKALSNEHIKIVGWVDEVEPVFAKRRIFVSYLRYGAGMKGKLGQALSLGLPVVSTTVGAEGMGLVDGETVLVADEPDSFADAVCRLYNDMRLWEKLSEQGKEYIEERYGETAVRTQLKRLLREF